MNDHFLQFSTGILMAASNYADQIQQIYIAYLGRPADAKGLQYWAAQADAQGGSLSTIIAGFSESAESQALYGNMTTAQVITAIYANLFNRQPDAAGLAYWEQQINSGAVPQAQVALTVLRGSQGTDTVSVSHKLTAANAFTANMDTDAENAGFNGISSTTIARAYLSKIDSTDASIANLAADAVVAVADATGTGSVTPPVVPGPTFTALLGGSTVTFGGTATGDISVSWSGAVGASDATFTRGGIAADPVHFGGSGGAAGVVLAASDTLDGSASTLIGLTVNGSGSIKLSDTAANLSTKVFTAATGLGDVLTVTDAPTSATDLSSLSGFETINLAGSIAQITVADGAGLTVNNTGTAALNLKLGNGGQIFNGGDGNDTVQGSAGDDIFNTGAGTNSIIGFGGHDTYHLAAGSTNTIFGLRTGDVLVNAATSSVTANSGSFIASAATENEGDATINGNNPGDTIDLSLATGSSGFTVKADVNYTIIGSAKSDSITAGVGSTVTGGGGADVFNFDATNRSTLNDLQTITDYRASTGPNAGAADTLSFADFVAVASNINTVQDLSAQVSLTSALNVFANAATTNNGLGVFIWGGDTYAYVETTGSTTTYVSTDTVIKLSGVPFAAGTAITGLGIDSV